MYEELLWYEDRTKLCFHFSVLRREGVERAESLRTRLLATERAAEEQAGEEHPPQGSLEEHPILGVFLWPASRFEVAGPDAGAFLDRVFGLGLQGRGSVAAYAPASACSQLPTAANTAARARMNHGAAGPGAAGPGAAGPADETTGVGVVAGML